MLGQNLRAPASSDTRTKWWFSELERGIEKRNLRIEEWERNEKYAFRDIEATQGEDNTQVNKLGSWIEARTAALAYRNPRAKLQPRNADGWEPVEVPIIDPQIGPVIDEMTGMPKTKFIPRFKVREHTLNYLLSLPNFRAAAEGRLGIKAAQLHGIGCFKVGYTADFESTEETAPPVPADQVPFEDPEYLKENYEYDGDTPMIDKEGMLVPKGQIPVNESWFIDWHDTKKMIFDPDGENRFADHRWVAYEYVKTLDEVKADPYFQNTDDLSATGSSRDKMHETAGVVGSFSGETGQAGDYRRRDKLVRLFEIWDKEHGRLIVLADGHGKPLRDDPFPDGIDGKTGPWSFYRPVERLGEWYGHEPASDLRILNDWYNKANKQSMNEMRKAAWKGIIDKRVVSHQDIERLTGPRNEMVALDFEKVPGSNPTNVMQLLQFPSVAPEMFRYSQIIAQNFDEVAGQPGESRGVASADTATQVKQLSARETMREDFQRAIYAECWREILKKLDDSIQANMTMEQAITINDGDGYAFMTMVTPELIMCDCDVDIDVEEMAPRDKMADKANFVQAMTVASQAPWLVMTPQGAEAFFEMFGINDRRLSNSISQGAMLQMQLAAAGAQGKQDAKPNNDPPRDEATAISQEGK